MILWKLAPLILALGMTACGAGEGEKDDKKEESTTGSVKNPGGSTGGTTTKTVCQTALTSFTTNVSPMIERCKECHTTGMPYVNYMNFGSDQNKNRLLLRDKKASTAEALYTFLSGTHTGKTALRDGDDENLKTWFAAEKACPAGSDGLQ